MLLTLRYTPSLHLAGAQVNPVSNVPEPCMSFSTTFAAASVRMAIRGRGRRGGMELDPRPRCASSLRCLAVSTVANRSQLQPCCGDWQAKVTLLRCDPICGGGSVWSEPELSSRATSPFAWRTWTLRNIAVVSRRDIGCERWGPICRMRVSEFPCFRDSRRRSSCVLCKGSSRRACSGHRTESAQPREHQPCCGW